ncbi:hypothetical protein [Embleya sp. NPDC050493]|uniref:hypothetical protein n=1 Tax=Embleya sp. NPDC050493 TaxID=3363989 RepID=UPI0037AF9EB2
MTLRPAREGAGRVGTVSDSVLTAEAVEATVQVRTADAAPVVSRLTITPRRTRRGANCGVDYNAQLHITDDASVTQP